MYICPPDYELLQGKGQILYFSVAPNPGTETATDEMLNKYLLNK